MFSYESGSEKIWNDTQQKTQNTVLQWIVDGGNKLLANDKLWKVASSVKAWKVLAEKGISMIIHHAICFRQGLGLPSYFFLSFTSFIIFFLQACVRRMVKYHVYLEGWSRSRLLGVRECVCVCTCCNRHFDARATPPSRRLSQCRFTVVSDEPTTFWQYLVWCCQSVIMQLERYGDEAAVLKLDRVGLWTETVSSSVCGNCKIEKVTGFCLFITSFKIAKSPRSGKLSRSSRSKL